MGKDVTNNFILSFELLEYFLACDILSCLGLLWLLNNLHLSKENVANLFRRCYVKLLASEFINTRLQFLHSVGENARGFFQ